ncbi:PREDICTED: zinc finger and BTB domain-containing protein 17-like [Branchiostoma belcheri]|uniref:Zinc finger and BTB domain-containing protein 17-like n=1 Tax=Branchiostoma belcheri TaxID=7741 RepID=A0A6P5AY09_BRABE|nr:PREDICTED: zinc finger and BTB domain-containing protein 17-like [Branchiostoma belcheri]
MSVWRDSPLFHPQTALRQLNASRHHNLYCDVTISVAGTRFRCHRAVLAANSVYFHHLLLPSNSSVLPSNGQPEPCYHLERMGAATFSALLQYMYTSQLFLSDERAARDLLHGARRVGLVALGDLVADYLLDSDSSEERAEPSADEEGGDPPEAGEEAVPADDRPEGKENPTFNLELLEPAEPGYHPGSRDTMQEAPVYNLGSIKTLPQESANLDYNLVSVDELPQEPADPGCELDTVPQEPADPGCKLDTVPQEPVDPGCKQDTVPQEPALAEPMNQAMTCLQNLSQLFSTNGRHKLLMVTANSDHIRHNHDHIRHNHDHIRHNHGCVNQPASGSPPGVGQGDQRSGSPDDPKEQRSGNSVDPRKQMLVNLDDPKEQRSMNSNDPKRQLSKKQSRKRGWQEGECSTTKRHHIYHQGTCTTTKRHHVYHQGTCTTTKRHHVYHQGTCTTTKRHHVYHQAHQRKENVKKGLPLKAPQQCPHWQDWTRHQRRHRKHQGCLKCGNLTSSLGLHREHAQTVCQTCCKCFIGKAHLDRHTCRNSAQESRVPFKCTKCKRMFMWG